MSRLPTTRDDKNLSDDEVSHPQSSTDKAASSDDENTDGYCLLSQNPDNNQDDGEEEEEEEINEDDEFLRFATLRVLSSIDDDDDDKTNPPVNLTPYPIEPVWTSKLESESFAVDDDKANYIKTVMSSIELPESSVPVWAQQCPEEDWQEKLRDQITCRQTTFFSKDNK